MLDEIFVTGERWKRTRSTVVVKSAVIVVLVRRCHLNDLRDILVTQSK